ncbi:MAG: hypothetical protein KHX03_06075 [Clostridium sp.]|nr:hypothetical protein [Clostridium sp.]
MTTTNSADSISPQSAMLKIERYNDDIADVIEETKEFILKNDCFYLSVDISGLNLIDAIKICILCSTFHYAKYCGLEIAGSKIRWIVKDNITKEQISLLKLDNIEIEVKKSRRNYADYGVSFPRVFSLCK